MTVRTTRLARALLVAVVLTSTGVTAANAAPAKGATAKAATPPTMPGYTAVTPQRVLDTRVAPAQPLGAAGTVSVKVTGVAHVPATGVAAVVLNVTGIARTHSTYLTVFPSGTTRPTTSNLNLVPGVVLANSVITPVGADGTVTVFSASGSTDVLVDINGYLSDTSSYTAQAPQRALDTRLKGGPLPSGGTVTATVIGHPGTPAPPVSAVVVNITGIASTSSTYLTAYPAGTTRVVLSNLNLAAGQTAAVLAIVPVSDSGQLSIFSSGGPTNVVIDVLGWFAGTTDYTPIMPNRFADSRGYYPKGMPNGSSLTISVFGMFGIPYNAGAVVLSLTAVKPTSAGFLTVHPTGTPESGTSSVNVAAGRTSANLVVAQVSSLGKFDVTNHARGADIVIDIVGWVATNPTLAITSTTPFHAQAGHPFDAQVQATSGRPPYSWSVGSSGLPAGLTLAADGQISGTPSTSGTTTASIVATDTTGETSTAPVQIGTHPFASRSVWGWGTAFPAAVLPIFVPDLIPVSTPVDGLPPAQQVALNTLGGYALALDGHVWSWGNDIYGGAGIGTRDNAWLPPTEVPGLTNVTSVVTTGIGVIALKSDGTVWSWGAAPGTGSLTTSPTTPVAVTGLPTIASLAAASSTAYAVGTDGTVWAWGSGNNGELGNGGLCCYATTPIKVHLPATTTFTAVAGGGTGAYALASDGTVWAWGKSIVQSGAGPVDSGIPVQVPGLTGVTQLAAGSSNGYALKADGALWAWGDDQYGELGDTSVTTRNSPAQIAGLPPMVQVAAGSLFAVALDQSGRAWTWGIVNGDNLGHQATDSLWSAPAPAYGPRLSAIATQPAAYTVLGIGLP